MSVLKVNFASMDDGVTALNTHWNQLQAHFADLDAKVQQLLPLWEGGAQAAYLAHHAKWRQSATQVHTALKQIHGNLSSTSQGFQLAETRIKNHWG